LVSLACFPAFLGLAAVAGDVVPVLLGDRWEGLVVPVQLMCLVLPFRALAVLLTPPLFGVGRPGIVVGNNGISLVVMTAAFL
jgi:teichuronic acid exporter